MIYRESVLDAPKDELNPNIWENNKLKANVKKQIFDIIKEYLNGYEIVQILLIGSNTGYQYNDETDVDIHIQVNDVSADELNDIYDGIPQVNVEGTDNPLQFYIHSDDEFGGKSGKGSYYDLMNDEWIEEPVKENESIPYTYIIEIAKTFMSGFDNRMMEYDSDVMEQQLYKDYVGSITDEKEKQKVVSRIEFLDDEIKADLDAIYTLYTMLYEYRRTGYDTESNYDYLIVSGMGNKAIQNMVYKILEKFGYKKKVGQYLQKRKGLK